MKLGRLACLIGFIGSGLATTCYADDVLLTANTGQDGVNVTMTSPAYSTEFSNPQSVPFDGWLRVQVTSTSEGESSSMRGAELPSGSDAGAASAVLGQPALYEDTLDIRTVPVSTGKR